MASAEVCPSCPPSRARVPRRPQLCEGCRSRLAGTLAELPELVQQLLERSYTDGVGWRLDAANRPIEQPVDGVARALPAGSVMSKAKAQRVSGTREKPAPLPLTVVDLTDQARYGAVSDPYGDQHGEIAVKTILDTAVRDIRTHRATRTHPRMSEGLPLLSAQHLTAWLIERLDDICNDYPAVAEFAIDVYRLRSVCRAQLGLRERDDEIKDGTTCPKCDHLSTLYRANGSTYIECYTCDILMSIIEYEQWLDVCTTDLIHLRGMVCNTCGYDRIYTRKSDRIHTHCGWCDWHAILTESSAA